MTRRPSLAGRLSRALAACVALALIVMVAASTLVMRSWMLGNMDSELHRLSQLAGEHLDAEDAPDDEVDADDGSDADSDDAGARAVPQSGGRAPRPGGPIVPGGPVVPGGPKGPGFGGSGIAEGTLQYVSEDGESAGAVVSNFSVTYLNEPALAILAAVPTDGAPHTVRLKGLGTFRATSQVIDGKTVLVGVQMDSVDDVVLMLVVVEVGLSLVVAIAAGFAGRAWVRRELRPLGVVRAAAADIASRDLADDAEELTRVGEEATSGPVEVADVAGALNSMIDAVEDGMERRARSEAKLRQFVADASHELRTPLASIRGYTELIRREGADADLPEEATYALERVHSESVRMTALVEDLLLLARLDAGRELRREEVDLVGLLVDTVADARAAGPDHDWQLDLAVLEPPADATPEEAEDFLPEPPLVIGDEARLRQVVVNLLANARVHTPAGSHVTTTLAREGDTLIVRIHDDGPGIAPEVRDRLFERFARGDSSRERRTGSTGLGMSIALAIVQSHGGSIDVDSSTAPEDHGTTFSVRLPAAVVEE